MMNTTCLEFVVLASIVYLFMSLLLKGKWNKWIIAIVSGVISFILYVLIVFIYSVN